MIGLDKISNIIKDKKISKAWKCLLFVLGLCFAIQMLGNGISGLGSGSHDLLDTFKTVTEKGKQ